MRNLAKIGFAGWCLWLVVSMIVAVAHSPGREATVLVWAAHFGGIPMIGGGCVLTWFLAKQPRIGLSIVLAVVSVFLIWKFYIGAVVFGMHPSMGGYTFSQSLSAWLSRNTSSFARFALWFPPMVLLAASLVFYPIYCIMHGDAA